MGIGCPPLGPANTVDSGKQISAPVGWYQERARERAMTYEAAIDRLLGRLRRDVPLLLDWPEVLELQRMSEAAKAPPQRGKLAWYSSRNSDAMRDVWTAEYGGHAFLIERSVGAYGLSVDGTKRSAHATLIQAQQRAELLID